MICGFPGMVIGIAIFFAWRNAEEQWKRTFAWFCMIAAGVSLTLANLLGAI